jgi:Protein of unknown function (DUF2985)
MLSNLQSKLPSKQALVKLLTPLTIFNISLLIIIIISGAILFMVMVGMIQKDADEKAGWFEVNAQILNACFTITAIMTQPMRIKMVWWTFRYYVIVT